jgi:hypothetical protein
MGVRVKKQRTCCAPVIVVGVLCFVGVIAYINQNNLSSINFNVMELQKTTPVVHTEPEQGSSLSTETTAAAAATDVNVTSPAVPSSASSYAMAARDSGGFLDDIAEDQWHLMKDRVKKRQNYFDPNQPSRNIQKPKAWYQENFEPDFTCQHERRIGGMGDGPKWVCDPHRLSKKEDCLVYSVGSEGNFMFENSILNEIGKNCDIHTFDPEMTGRKYGGLAPPGVNYHNWGFKSEKGAITDQARFDPNINTNRGTFKTMKETIKELGHEGRVIDVFKIDCEGCEWTTFDGWFDAGATLRQILVEVHNTPADKVNNFFLGMQKAGYVTFHKEPNIQWADGNCVEYAFLKLEDSFFSSNSLN